MDFYKVLRVKPSANQQEIREAAHRMKTIWDPDEYGRYGKTAQKVFKDIQNAEMILGDPRKRNLYDRLNQYDMVPQERIQDSVSTNYRPSIPCDRPCIDVNRGEDKIDSGSGIKGSHQKRPLDLHRNRHYYDPVANGVGRDHDNSKLFIEDSKFQSSLLQTDCGRYKSRKGPRNISGKKHSDQRVKSKAKQIALPQSSEEFFVANNVALAGNDIENDVSEEIGEIKESFSYNSVQEKIPHGADSPPQLFSPTTSINPSSSDENTISVKGEFLQNKNCINISDGKKLKAMQETDVIPQSTLGRGISGLAAINEAKVPGWLLKNRKQLEGLKSFTGICPEESADFQVNKRNGNRDVIVVHPDHSNLRQSLKNKKVRRQPHLEPYSTIHSVDPDFDDNHTAARVEGVTMDVSIKSSDMGSENNGESNGYEICNGSPRKSKSENTIEVTRVHGGSRKVLPDSNDRELTLASSASFKNENGLSRKPKPSRSLTSYASEYKKKLLTEKYPKATVEQNFENDPEDRYLENRYFDAKASNDTHSEDGHESIESTKDSQSDCEHGSFIGSPNYPKSASSSSLKSKETQHLKGKLNCNFVRESEKDLVGDRNGIRKNIKGASGRNVGDSSSYGGLTNASTPHQYFDDGSSKDQQGTNSADGRENNTRSDKRQKNVTIVNICNTQVEEVSDCSTLTCNSLLHMHTVQNISASQLRAKVTTDYSEDLTWKKIESKSILKCLEMVTVYKFNDEEEWLEISLEGRLVCELVNGCPKDITTDYYEPCEDMDVPLAMRTRIRANGNFLEIARIRDLKFETVEVLKNGILTYKLEKRVEA